MRPRCSCHTVPMHKSGQLVGGATKWRCAVRNLATVALWQKTYPVAAAVKAALWRERNPEDYAASQTLYAAKRARRKASQ